MGNVTNPRWWEFYLVRYFVGTIVGTIVVIAIASNKSSLLHPFFSSMINFGTKEFNVSHLWLFALIGLAFCYLASSPILVLHAFRTSIFSRQLREVAASTTFIKKWWKVILYWSVLIVIGIFVFLFFEVDYNVFLKLKFWILFLMFFLQAYIISFQLRHKSIFLMYKKLSYARASNANAKKEYIESYKHLREHGNAFMILIMELILGFILYNVTSATMILLILLFWILPSASVWFVGTYLESRIREV